MICHAFICKKFGPLSFLTLSAHAQRRLFVLGLCVCLSTLISALQATKRMVSDINGFIVTSAGKINGDFPETAAF